MRQTKGGGRYLPGCGHTACDRRYTKPPDCIRRDQPRLCLLSTNSPAFDRYKDTVVPMPQCYVCSFGFFVIALMFCFLLPCDLHVQCLHDDCHWTPTVVIHFCIDRCFQYGCMHISYLNMNRVQLSKVASHIDSVAVTCSVFNDPHPVRLHTTFIFQYKCKCYQSSYYFAHTALPA